MVDHIERYLQQLKERGKVRVISSRVSLQKNIGKRTGKKISVGGIADVSGLFCSFDSDSCDTSDIKDKPPLNSTSISTKTDKRLPPPPTYENASDGEVLQPTESNNKLDSDYYSLAVDSSSAKPPNETLSRTYVDHATDGETDEGQKDVSHREIATQMERENVLLPDQRATAEKTCQSDYRDQSNINRTSDSRRIHKSVISSRKKSQSREPRAGSPRKETVVTPSGKPDILKEYRQMISSEKSRCIIHDGTGTGSLTKKTALLTPKQSHQNLLRRKLSFKGSSQEEGSPKPAITMSPREVSAIHPIFELDDSSSNAHEEVIIDANDPKAQEKVGLVFVTSPKVTNPSLLRRRRSSTKRDGTIEKKSSKKSEQSETGKINKRKTQSRGRPKSREESFSHSKNKRDSSSTVHTGRRSTGRPKPQPKRSQKMSESRQDTLTSAESLPSQWAKKFGKPPSRILVEYSSSNDDEGYDPRSERKFPSRSPLKAVHNQSRTECRMSNRERHSHHETLAESDIAVSDDEETQHKRLLFNKNLAEKDAASRKSERKRSSSREVTKEQVLAKRNKESGTNSRTSRVQIASDSENHEKRKSNTGKGSKKKQESNIQSVKSDNEGDNTDTQSDLPYKKRRSNSFRIDKQSSDGDERDATNQRSASRSNRRRLYWSSSGDFDTDQPTVIEKLKSPNRSEQQSPTKQRKMSWGKKTSNIRDTDLDQPEEISNSVLEIDNTAGSSVSALSTLRRKRKLDTNKKNLTKSHPKVGKMRAVQQSPSLKEWLDSGQDKSFSVQLPTTPAQNDSPDVTKSTVVNRRSRKIIIDSPAHTVTKQPNVERSPLPTVDESAIINSVYRNREFGQPSNYIGPPASTPKRLQLTQENLLVHDRIESILNAAPPSLLTEGPSERRAVTIRSKSEESEDSRDDLSRDSYTLPSKTAPKRITDEISKSSRKVKSKNRGGKSKNRRTKTSKDNSEQDEEQRTLVASDNEHTLVEEGPKKKNKKPISRITKRMGKLQSGPLFLHERHLDIVVPEETAIGVRRSKRIRTSRPLGYGEKFVYSEADKHGVRNLVGFQSSNGLVSFHAEEVQGGKVHIESNVPPDVSDMNMKMKNSIKNPRKKAGKKKMKDKNTNKIGTLKGVASKRTEENTGNSGNEQENMAWFDDMNIASTEEHAVDSASGTEENRSVANKTIQLVDYATGYFVVKDISAIHVNESRHDGQYVGSVYNKDGVIITKGIGSKEATQGKIIIEPQKEKKERIAHNADMIFTVFKGTVKVTIGDTGFTVKKGSYIVVPCKNPYRICNLSSKTKAELFYTLLRVQ